MANIRLESLHKPVEVGEYLFLRLAQLGIKSIFGVPGDYNLESLDQIEKCKLKWVGNANELNAGYAADGYARVKGISAIVTTFGVGELSAINGLAGAFSEKIPVVHIVGCPSTISQRDGLLLHHTLGNGNFNVFAEMSSQISCEVAKLKNPSEIASQIDHVLRECLIESRPVYIMLPTDMVHQKIEGQRLEQPIDLTEPENDTEREDFVVDAVLELLNRAKDPIVLVDACAIRHNVLKEVHLLLEKTGLPVFVTPMGKGAIDETSKAFGGVYAGVASYPPEARGRVENSDLILSIGALKSDFNTAGFSYRTSQLKTVDFHSTFCAVKYSEFPGVRMRGALRKLADRADPHQIVPKPSPDVENEVELNRDSAPIITQKWFWPRIGEFLRENDVVITETGTSNFGIWNARFPRGCISLNQTLWGSIGWSVGACQGAVLAVRDANQDRRTILFVGDGSLQLTIQEISTMLRHGLKPIIFTICNDGYTIERLIHGMDASYNDVPTWRYKDVVDAFGGESKKYQVRTKEELEHLLVDKIFNSTPCLQFVEVYMDKKDAPEALVRVAQESAKLNARTE